MLRMNTEQKNTNQNINAIMKDLEYKYNPKSIGEGFNMLANASQTKNPNIITNSLNMGAKEFEERVGRPMTYSEMRAMWG